MGLSDPIRIASAKWHYLGKQRIMADGASFATLPQGTTVVVVTAEIAAVRFAINAAADGNATPIASDTARVIGPLVNLQQLGVFNASNSVAHLEYYRESAA